MSWISFVIVVTIFYMPYVGLGNLIETQFEPIVGGALLLSLNIILWALLWALMAAVHSLHERRHVPDLLSRLYLRDGMLYAFYPYLANSSRWLATIVVGYELLRWTLLMFSIFLLSIFDRLTLVLSVFTLIAASGYRLEQRRQYEYEVQKQRHEYKQRQKSIVV